MWRALGMFGMGGFFLAISPSLRQTVYSGLESGVNRMAEHSPWSYVGAVAALLIFGGITLSRGSQAR